MKRISGLLSQRLCVALILSVGVLAVEAQDFAEPTSVRRYGVFIGANDGGPGRATLRWAESDAEKMLAVLEEFGGLDSGNAYMLRNPSVADVYRTFGRVGATMSDAKSASRRVELFVYYSGHSDETGLKLGNERLGYESFREAIVDVDADVSIVVLDSCASGAFTRIKGGVRVPPFMMDESSEMRGHAYLTSASATEAAQESDRLGASFFTHYLVSGLRGAADNTNDGRVTLNEAYHYAFSETLAQTQATLAGPQHASYEIQLHGRGDLVLSDFSASSSAMVLSPELSGRTFVRAEAGTLVAEFTKSAGRSMTVGVPPGPYVVTIADGGTLHTGRVVVRSFSPTPVGWIDLRPDTIKVHRTRGETPGVEYSLENDGYARIGAEFGERLARRIQEDVSRALERSLSAAAAPRRQPGVTHQIDDSPPFYVPLHVQFVPGLPAYGWGRPVVAGLSVSPIIAQVDHLVGLQASGVGSIATRSVSGLQTGGVFSITGGPMRGVQAAGVFALAEGPVDGAQIGGVFTSAESGVRGAQIAGVFNSARDVHGIQVGLVNVAEGTVHGTQIGLVNVAHDMYGVPIGLFTWIAKGIHDTTMWFSGPDSGHVWIGSMNGSRNFYRIAYLGASRDDITTLDRLAGGVGFGTRFPFRPFYVDLELTAKRASEGGTPEERFTSLFIGPVENTFPHARGSIGVAFGKVRGFVGLELDGLVNGWGNTTHFHTHTAGEPFEIALPGAIALTVFPKFLMGFSFF